MSDERRTDRGNERPTADAPPFDWRDARRQERDQRHTWRRGGGGASIAGLILIFLGVIFMLQNFGIAFGGNWWALFLLIPAIACFGAARRIFQHTGSLSPAVVGPLTAGIVFTTITLAFLLGIDFGLIWPVFLILAGLGALFGGVFPRR